MTAVFEIPEPVVSPSGAGGGGGLRSQPVRIPLAAERQQLGKLCRSLFVRLMALVREKASAGKDNHFAVRQTY